MNFKNITIAGSGVLGYQIAFQSAFFGFEIVVYDINDEVLDKAKAKFNELSDAFIRDMNATQEQLDATKQRISYNSNLEVALQDADLLIEAIPENPQIKIDFYTKVAKLAPAKTVFATNSSTLLPSQFAAYTGRPEKFVALHFANEIWKHNTGEVMRHSGTSDEVFESLLVFAKQIGMVPLALHKEQPGYIINAINVPMLSAAMQLWANDIADPETIDKAWMISVGAPQGPFGMLDIIGITTAYNINKMQAEATNDPVKLKIAELLKEGYIDQNKLGTSTGEGFYKYPNPKYKEEDFLK